MFDQGHHECLTVWKVVHQARLGYPRLAGNPLKGDRGTLVRAGYAQPCVKDSGALAFSHIQNLPSGR